MFKTQGGNEKSKGASPDEPTSVLLSPRTCLWARLETRLSIVCHRLVRETVWRPHEGVQLWNATTWCLTVQPNSDTLKVKCLEKRREVLQNENENMKLDDVAGVVRRMGKHRPILMLFTKRSTRDEIWRKAKASPICWDEETGFTEHLTREDWRLGRYDGQELNRLEDWRRPSSRLQRSWGLHQWKAYHAVINSYRFKATLVLLNGDKVITGLSELMLHFLSNLLIS